MPALSGRCPSYTAALNGGAGTWHLGFPSTTLTSAPNESPFGAALLLGSGGLSSVEAHPPSYPTVAALAQAPTARLLWVGPCCAAGQPSPALGRAGNPRRFTPQQQ